MCSVGLSQWSLSHAGEDDREGRDRGAQSSNPRRKVPETAQDGRETVGQMPENSRLL